MKLKLTRLTESEKEEFDSMMEKEMTVYNNNLVRANKSKNKPPNVDRKDLIHKGEQIFRKKRSLDPTARVPKCMEGQLSAPYANSTVKGMVETAVKKLKLQKDGRAPSQCSANTKVRNAKQKEKETPEEAEARRLRNAEANRREKMERKLSSQVIDTTPLSNEPRMELFSNECLAVIVSAATKCDKLNYILHQVGNKALQKRMNLPPLAASKMAELCKYLPLIYAIISFINLIKLQTLSILNYTAKQSYSINVCTSKAHRADVERFSFTTDSSRTGSGYIRWKVGSSEFEANKSNMKKKHYDVPTISQASDLFDTQLIIQTSNDGEYDPRSTEGTLHLALQDAPIGVPEDNTITRLWTVPNQGSKSAQGPHVVMISIATGLGENSSIVKRIEPPSKSSDEEITSWERKETQRKDIEAKYSSTNSQQGPVLFIAAKVSKETFGKGATIVYTGNEIDKSADIEARVCTSVSLKTTLLVCGLQHKLAPGVLSSAEQAAFNLKIPVMDYVTYNALVNGTQPLDGRVRLIPVGSGTCKLADTSVGSSLAVAKKKTGTKPKPKAKPKSSSSSAVPKDMRKSPPELKAQSGTFKTSTSSSSGDTATSNIKKASKPMPSSSAKRSSSSTVKSTTSASTMTSSGKKRKGSIKSNLRPAQAPRVSLDEQQVTSSSAQAAVSTSAQASSMSGQGATGNKKKKQVKLGAFFKKEEK